MTVPEQILKATTLAKFKIFRAQDLAQKIALDSLRKDLGADLLELRNKLEAIDRKLRVLIESEQKDQK